MAFTFDAIFAVDPNNPANVAKNASITIFDPADPTQAAITITDPTGVPLPNPITVDAAGMGPAYQHPTLARVGWKGAGFTGYFTSYEGMYNETLAARTAAEEAAGNASAAASTATATVTAALAGAVADAEAAATSAANAAALVGAPADTAIAAAVTGNGATKAALDGAITSDMTTSFTGVNGWAYGNSWINSANYGAQQYPLRLPAKTGMASMTELASSGFRMQDTAVHALGTVAPFSWPAGRKGFVVVGDLLNNLIEADTTANRDTALHSMRSLVAVLSASQRIEQNDAAFTYTGTWSTLTTDSVSGGTARYVAHTVSNTTEGVSYFDVAVPAGVNYLCFVGTMSGSTTNGATAIIREGATELGRISTDDKSVATPYGIAAGVRAPVVFRVPGTTARTLRVTLTGNSSTAALHTLLIDCLITQSTTPPLIVLVKPVQTLISTHDKPDLLTYLRTVPDTVKAEFGDHVLVVDPATGWDPATMLGADLLHPNEAGQAHLSNAIVKALKAEIVRRQRISAFGTLV